MNLQRSLSISSKSKKVLQDINYLHSTFNMQHSTQKQIASIVDQLEEVFKTRSFADTASTLLNKVYSIAKNLLEISISPNIHFIHDNFLFAKTQLELIQQSWCLHVPSDITDLSMHMSFAITPLLRELRTQIRNKQVYYEEDELCCNEEEEEASSHVSLESIPKVTRRRLSNINIDTGLAKTDVQTDISNRRKSRRSSMPHIPKELLEKIEKAENSSESQSQTFSELDDDSGDDYLDCSRPNASFNSSKGLSLLTRMLPSKSNFQTEHISTSCNEETKINPNVSSKSTLTNFRRRSRKSRSSSPTIDSIDERRTLSARLISCRLCERLFSSGEIEDHATICATNFKSQEEYTKLDERLKKFLDNLDGILINTRQATGKSVLEFFERKLLMRLREIGHVVAVLDLNDLVKVEISLKDSLNQLRTLILDVDTARTCVLSIIRRIYHVVRQKSDIVSKIMFIRSQKSFNSQSLVPVDNNENETSSDAALSHRSASPGYEPPKPSPDDFAIIKPISRGAFGSVYLARKKQTGDLFAIKVVEKRMLAQRKNPIQYIQAERDILAQASNPFVVCMYYAFQSTRYFYFVLEYLPGGDLFSLLQTLGGLEEKDARNFVADLVLALEHLFSFGIIHRDLKPDNLVIAKNGHIKLTDFGLSSLPFRDGDQINPQSDSSPKATLPITPPASFSHLTRRHSSFPAVPMTPFPSKTKKFLLPDSPDGKEIPRKGSLVGSPHYIAPEIILGKQHDKSSDFWSLGIIIYELISGLLPFDGETPAIVMANILTKDVPWEEVEELFSPDAIDLVTKLLNKVPTRRPDLESIKSHPFFNSINWDSHINTECVFHPVLDTETDVSYFEARSEAWPMPQSWKKFFEGDEEHLNAELANDDMLPGFAFKNISSLTGLTMLAASRSLMEAVEEGNESESDYSDNQPKNINFDTSPADNSFFSPPYNPETRDLSPPFVFPKPLNFDCSSPTAAGVRAVVMQSNSRPHFFADKSKAQGIPDKNSPVDFQFPFSVSPN